MPGIIVIFVIVFIVIAIISSQQAQRTRESWSKAAMHLGLRFEPGGTFSNPVIYGTKKGFDIRVTTVTKRSGKNSRRYTTFRVTYPQPIGGGLRLTQEGFFSGVARLFGAQDIEVGDAGFDAGVVVKGGDPEEVTRFLTPARRVRIQRLFGSHPGAVVDERSISWETRGVIRVPERIVSTVKTLLRVAWSMTGERGGDQAFDRAMEAQSEGRIEEALAILGERTRRDRYRPPEPPARENEVQWEEDAVSPVETGGVTDAEAGDFEPEAVEEELLEAELLHLGGRHDEAKEVFEQAAKKAPDDPELRKWTEHLARKDQAEQPEQPPPQEPPVCEGLDVKTVCDILFDPKHSSFDAKRAFEERYSGKPIEWHGTLRSAESYSYDLVLGSEPGTKAAFEVYDLPEVPYGERKVLAIVGLPPDALGLLEGKTGTAFTFRGRLLKVDGFMRNLYVAEGTVVA